jgi:potassium efflux system protein
LKQVVRLLSTLRTEALNGGRAAPVSVAAARRAAAQRARSPWSIVALVLLLTTQPALCQEPPATAAPPGSVAQETLEAKIAEVEAATGIEEEARTKLVELYRKALSNLQTASSNARAAEDFRRAAETAPAEVQALREALDEADARPPEDSLDLDPSTPLRQIEQLLAKEKADLAAVDARRADFEQRLEEEAARPMLIRQRLTEAKRQQEEIAIQLKLPAPADEGPATSEARRWALETGSDALSTEIKQLDQELLSQPARVDLLKAKRDKASASVEWVGARVKLLEALVGRKRQQEAEQALAAAEATRREAQGKHPLVLGLAERNAALSEALVQAAPGQTALAEQTEQTDKLARRIETQFKSARDTVAIGGLSQELGRLLQQQRHALPDLVDYRRAARARENTAAEIGLRRLRHWEEENRLLELDDYLAQLMAGATEGPTPLLRQQLRELAVDRRELLEKAVAADDDHLRRLGELETAQQRLLDAVADYDAFLDEHLLWVRNTSLFQLDQASAMSLQMGRVLSPTGWRQVARTISYEATHSPLYALLVALLALSLWGRGRLIAMIRGLNHKLGKPTTDHFGYTLLALGLTVIAAAPWPLLVAATGWQLQVSAEATDFTTAVGGALLFIAIQFFWLRLFRLICMKDGLAAAHFRWPEPSLRLLRSQLQQLSWIFLPAALAAMVAARLDFLDAGWALGLLPFLMAMGSLAVAFARLLHPRRGVLAEYVHQRRRRTFKQLQRFWYPLLVVYPIALGVLALLGYLYTAGTLSVVLLDTAWFLVELILLAALGQRWLLVARRRLAFDAAMERRRAEKAERRSETPSHVGEEGRAFDAEEAEVDLVALSDTSRKLVNTALLLYGFFGLWLLWSDLFPALRILDQVTLWNHTVTVDGAAQILPVTLASIGLALFYAAITVMLAKQLPAVLEIILLKFSELSAGSRYTVTTLANYVVVTAGAVLVFQTLGTEWSQLQWLVAALGVGIGFGLQEIVANFISGIIVLFERPIRIGDVITIGDTDGVVTRIRGRATTIRNWDGKELLVPNKEFITGRLLNWSLSDQTTRVILSVGIAYGSDVRLAMRLLEEAAGENENVLHDPSPSVIFEAFGDNSLGLLLRCFVDSTDLRFPAISALNQAINDKFNAAGIVIAFPQRDLHLNTTRPLQVELRHTAGPSQPERAGKP